MDESSVFRIYIIREVPVKNIFGEMFMLLIWIGVSKLGKIFIIHWLTETRKLFHSNNYPNQMKSDDIQITWKNSLSTLDIVKKSMDLSSE